ncbi:hypothetical protein QJS22_gp44 [Pseudomonas phage vB_Pae-SS2019XII]|uniref:Uncharacterized protein n=6 Tax=root TaxID=1 RepID=A0A5Q2FA51_9CAUD|nr:hypothetical protein QJS22_gp44 [Pseudomonas phage vB_Pae-SS2019XII]QGF21188.1 hypothetical protein vBPaeSS2019XII_044 [Pseudomonas phage vB_Pae-SS2019XII]
MRHLPCLARLRVSQRLQVTGKTLQVEAVINCQTTCQGNKRRAHRRIKNQVIGGSHVCLSDEGECTPSGWRCRNGFANGENSYLFGRRLLGLLEHHPMKRRNWKHWVPRSPADALDGCAQLAMQRYNRGIERLACDHLGQNNHSSLYKWIGNGRLPLSLILPLEHACGLPLITRYLAAAHGKLLVDIPIGKACNASDLQQLQVVLHNATGALMAFYDGKQSAEQTLDAIRAGLESLAWHHGNVAQAETPQLDFGVTDDE